jgi:hypothetical protein
MVKRPGSGADWTMVAPLRGCSQEDQRAHAVTCRKARPAQAERWPLAVLGRVLAPAGVRLLTVGGPHPDPLDATPEGDRGSWDAEAPGTAGQPEAGRAGSRSPRVLLVDDSPAMRRVLRGLLEDAGIPVVGEAVDGAHGVELALTLRPDVVLMDWRRPQGVGGGILPRQAGASASVAKGAPPEQLWAAVLAAWQPPS